jgi:hypothetical protein
MVFSLFKNCPHPGVPPHDRIFRREILIGAGAFLLLAQYDGLGRLQNAIETAQANGRRDQLRRDCGFAAIRCAVAPYPAGRARRHPLVQRNETSIRAAFPLRLLPTIHLVTERAAMVMISQSMSRPSFFWLRPRRNHNVTS